jgi:hypothetical protein
MSRKTVLASSRSRSRSLAKTESGVPVRQKTMPFYDKAREGDQEFKPPMANMERDLLNSAEMCTRCKESEAYSQNLYAALCNNSFARYGEKCEHSWRHAGSIVAEMRGEGGYIDWYCSGLSGAQGFVIEGEVTEEIKLDLLSLGWIVL